MSDVADVRDLLDPELRPVLDAFELPPLDHDGIAAMRRASFAAPELSDAVARTDHVVPGDPPVRVRVHRPVGREGRLPAIVTIHGGGYVIGSYDMDDPAARPVVPGARDRRRLRGLPPRPGDPVPGAARRLLRRVALDLRPRGRARDRPRAASASTGSSAGGGLAAALALLARDRGEIPLAFQLLDCPMLDDRQTTPSIRAHGLYVWSSGSNEFGWRSYLGELYESDDVPVYAAPARATELGGTATDLCDRGLHRRLPRRGHRLRPALEPSRRAL